MAAPIVDIGAGDRESPKQVGSPAVDPGQDNTTTSGDGLRVVSGGSVFQDGDADQSVTLIGGEAESDTAYDATADGNVVIIDGTVSADGSGSGNNDATVTIIGGSAKTDEGVATATNSAVTINGTGTVNATAGGTGDATVTIIGGKAEGTGTGSIATATGNSVTINDGAAFTVDGTAETFEVYGGWAEANDTATATGNTVTINATMGLDKVDLYGGHTGGSGAGDAFTGNTLNLNSDAAINSAQNFASVIFGDIGTANIDTLGTTATGAAVTPLVQLDTQGHTIDFTGVVSGTGGINVQGNGGTFILSKGANYTGNTAIAAGSKLEVTGTFGTATNYGGDIANEGALVFEQAGTQFLSGIISGAGSLTLDSTGQTLTLSGANTYTGDTTITDGKLDVTGTLGAGDYIGNIFNEGILQFTQSADQIISGAITGAGKLVQAGSGILTLRGLSAIGGDMDVTGGAVYIDNSTAVSGTVTVNDGAELAVTNGNTQAATGNVTFGDGSRFSVGSAMALITDGTLTFGLSGSESELNITAYTGSAPLVVAEAATSIVNEDQLTTLVAGNAIDTTTNTFLDVVVSKTNEDSKHQLVVTSSLLWDNDDPTKSHGTFNIADGTFTIGDVLRNNEDADVGVGHNWDGESLTKIGGGELILAGANTYTGDTTINAGTLTVTGSLGADTVNDYAGSIIVNAGTLVFNQAADQTLSGEISGAGSLTQNSTGQTLTLSGANTSYTGGTTITAGTLKVTGSLGGGDYGSAIANSGVLIFDQNTAQELSGIISGTGSLTKDGTGTLTLSGANSYTGLTEVRAGTLALSGAGKISPILVLYGGSTFDTGGTTVYYLNRLDVRGTSDWIGDLDMAGKTMNFYLPTTMAAGGTMLTVDGDAYIDDSTVNVGIAGASTPLKAGDKVVLIDADSIDGTPANSTSDGTGMQGVTLKYKFDILTEGDQLLAVVDSTGPTVDKEGPAAKSLLTSFMSGPALAAQGADLVAGQGMGNAVSSAQGVGPAVGGFGAISGGSVRYKTGSHVDMNSFSLLTGLAWGNTLASGRMTLGAFFEFGTGSYDTYNSFANAASVKGDGDTRYYGGGILGRMAFTNNVYTEVSARMGRIKNEYRNNDLTDVMGNRASYDTNSNYYGLHLGTGYVWNIDEKASLDLHAKYFWTRVGGDSVRLSTGDPVEFDSVNSHRTRLGSRFSYAVTEYVSPYIGAAWEHEFDGKATATAFGQSLGESKISGSTGIGEIGLTLTPTRDMPLFLDLGVQGYTGKREGVTGSLQLRFEF